MKKQILKAFLILAIVSSGSAFAAGTITSAGTSIGTQSYKPSNNVTVFVASAAGTSTSPGGYAATSAHASGDRQFATNSAEPKIYWKAKDSSNTQVVPAVGTDGAMSTPSDWTGWNSL